MISPRPIENLLLVALSALVCCSVLAYNAVGILAPDSVEIPESSDLESRYYEAAPEPTFQAISDKSFQDGIDRYLADHVPLRDFTVLANAGLQRSCIAGSAALCGYGLYPTFFNSRYYVVSDDGLILERSEEAPGADGDAALEAWVNTLNDAAASHPDTRFVYDCVARHDQSEANPTYPHYDNRLNASWVQANLLDRLDPRIDSFIDAAQSYGEIRDEWFATDCHWMLKRALGSYNLVAERLSLERYAYENPVTIASEWHGSYAHSGLDLDYPLSLQDLPIDFSYLTYYNLDEFGGGECTLGAREAVLSGDMTMQPDLSSQYYGYFGGGDVEIVNGKSGNGKTMVLVCDSLSYCLHRFFASNYSRVIMLMPGNSRLEGSFGDYLDRYDPDDVVILLHATKYLTFADYSPTFIGL